MALAVAAKLGQKTLVVVDKLALMNQWKKEVEKVFGFIPDMIGGGHDSYDTPIVIGNVASLYKRMAILGKEFGCLIMDEVHHAPSPTFTKIIDRSYARYKIGLSGTLERKDGMHVVLTDFFSKKIFKPEKENTVDPVVHVYNTGLIFPIGDIWANRVTALNNSPLYQELMLRIIKKYENLGHKVLYVSDRVDFLRIISERAKSSLIIGHTNDRDEEFAKLDRGDTSSLGGSLSILKEGISYNPFSCLVLGVPINNTPMLEQLIGRIQRQHEGKLTPIVVDLCFKGHTPEKQFLTRWGHYVKEGYKIEYL
jgi:superfamily II DNA or RNA helicase